MTLETYTYLPGDPPMTCPKCGARTNWAQGEGSNFQSHHCPKCNYMFRAEEEKPDPAYLIVFRTPEDGVQFWHGGAFASEEEALAMWDRLENAMSYAEFVEIRKVE